MTNVRFVEKRNYNILRKFNAKFSVPEDYRLTRDEAIIKLIKSISDEICKFITEKYYLNIKRGA